MEFRSREVLSVPSKSVYRIGCDIGGTFTDVVVMDERGRITLVKEETTPRNPELGAQWSIRKALQILSTPPKQVSYVCHATTIATNALIGQANIELSKTGFITTKGFRDLIEIGRQIRPDPYNFLTDKPKPLVPRRLRKEVEERIAYDGSVLEELEVEGARRVIGELGEEGVEAVAVCTLFSFLNPVHEELLGELIRRELPGVEVCLSHRVLPEFREYERASTTIINTLLLKVVRSYLNSLRRGLEEMGLRCTFYVMQSNGRTMSVEVASERPVSIVESGPAAGVVAAAYMAEMMGRRNMVSFDMGGTTAKVCLIEGCEPKVTTEYEVGGAAASGRIVRGSGWPIGVSVIDLVEIGAGGGSVAWVDPGGALRVGPRSVGADPGPACYGKGGVEPTVTDAYVVLGVINPEFFVGGEMRIDPALAKKSVLERVGQRLGMDEVEVADGIAEVANSNMMRALKIVTLERGCDPRELDMMAFGGAGPMVAGRLMEELEFKSVIIPEAPGLFSAYGLLITSPGHDHSLTRIQALKDADALQLEEEFRGMEERGIKELQREVGGEARILLRRSLDMRYRGQSYELNIPLTKTPLTKDSLKWLEEAFHEAHRARYGYSALGEPVEIVNLRVRTIAETTPLRLMKEEYGGEDPEGALKGLRQVYFHKVGSFVECPIYDRYRLKPGNRIRGPALIEQRDSTTVVQPGHRATVDCYRQLIMSISPP